MKILFTLSIVILTIQSQAQTQVICGNQPVPSGWITVSIGGVCGTTGGVTFYSRTIRKIDTMATGSTIQICGDVAPAGWVTTAMGVCGPNNGYLSRTIRKISAAGSTAGLRDTAVVTVSKMTLEPDTAVQRTDTGNFGISAYPNPSNGGFRIQVNEHSVGHTITYKVYDINGRFIEGRNTPLSTEFSVGSGYTPGVYLLQVFNGKTWKSLKLVKL